MPVPYKLTKEGAFDADVRNALNRATLFLNQVLTGAADVLEHAGLVLVLTAGVDAMTLTAPKAGDASVGGEDGSILMVADGGGHAHTVTGPTNCFNGSTHIATFNGTVASLLMLVAYGGAWYTIGTAGITLS